MGPTLCRLLAVMTEWVWDSGVRGAVGVVGVWGRLKGGEDAGAVLERVTLDTRLSWERKPKYEERKKRAGRSFVS